MSEVKKIPNELQLFIDRYFNLNIAGKKVIAPYFINLSGRFLANPVMAGKGSPDQIESISNEMLSNLDKENLTEDSIREEMLKYNIGIDCSGLVYQIYNFWLKEIEKKGDLKDFLPKQNGFNIRKILSRKLKPESSVSADMFTSEPISSRIELKDIKPGDVIRTKGGKHILFVTEVEYKDNRPVKIKFVNSARFYKRHGVRYSEIVLDKELDLGKAEWKDNDKNEEVNHTYKGYRELMSNNGIFRPYFLNSLNN